MNLYNIRKVLLAKAITCILTFTILSCFIINGCLPTATNPTIQYPIIQVPSKPILQIISTEDLRGLSDETIRKIIFNDDTLKHYIEQLEASITTYNNWAREQNR